MEKLLIVVLIFVSSLEVSANKDSLDLFIGYGLGPESELSFLELGVFNFKPLKRKQHQLFYGLEGGGFLPIVTIKIHAGFTVGYQWKKILIAQTIGGYHYYGFPIGAASTTSKIGLKGEKFWFMIGHNIPLLQYSDDFPRFYNHLLNHGPLRLNIEFLVPFLTEQRKTPEERYGNPRIFKRKRKQRKFNNERSLYLQRKSAYPNDFE